MASTPTEVEHRSDIYDISSARNGVGRKHRGSDSLDVKFLVHVTETESLARGVTGRVEDWLKVSEPLRGLPSQELTEPLSIEKLRVTRRFDLKDGIDAGCEVELADIRAGNLHAWSLCFETFGSPGHRHEALRHGVGRLLAETPEVSQLPLTAQASLAYPEWIGRLTREMA